MFFNHYYQPSECECNIGSGVCRMPEKPLVTQAWCKPPATWSPSAGYKCALGGHSAATSLKYTPCTGDLIPGMYHSNSITSVHIVVHTATVTDLFSKRRKIQLRVLFPQRFSFLECMIALVFRCLVIKTIRMPIVFLQFTKYCFLILTLV